MRILISNEALSGGGGVETYLSAVIPALRDRGHAVAVLHHNTAAECGPTRIAPPDVMTISVVDDGLERAFARAHEWSPEAVFAHNMQYVDVERRLVRSWPVAKMMHFYVGTCVSGQKAHTFPGVTPCTRRFGPACAVLYLPRRCGRLRPGVLVSQYRQASAQNGLLPEYKNVVVASAYMAAEYARHGFPTRRIHTVPLFATDGPAGVRDANPDGPIVFLGRLTEIKGVERLVRAVAGASEQVGRSIPLVVAGEGPELATLKSLARSLKVDATFPGWVDPCRRRSLLSEAALLAVPSIWPEPFGLSGLEAAAFGVPAVAFEVGGIPQWLTDNKNGRLVPLHEGAAGLANAIAAILRDPSEHARLSSGARAMASRHSIAGHVDRIEEILRETAAS
jgi:glycosyltransferase involved in cell wall biosynthesis